MTTEYGLTYSRGIMIILQIYLLVLIWSPTIRIEEEKLFMKTVQKQLANLSALKKRIFQHTLFGICLLKNRIAPVIGRVMTLHVNRTLCFSLLY